MWSDIMHDILRSYVSMKCELLLTTCDLLCMYCIGLLIFEDIKFEDCQKFTLNFKQNILWKNEDGQVVSNQSTVLMIDTLRFCKHPWNPQNILFSKINFPTGYGCLHFMLISSWTRLELFPSYQQCISKEILYCYTDLCCHYCYIVDVCVGSKKTMRAMSPT